jgi:hypothetical protein
MPKVKKHTPTIQKELEIGMSGMQRQNRIEAIFVILAEPYCVVSQPVMGIAINAPTDIANNNVPKTLFEIFKLFLSSGNRAIKLACRNPFTKKKNDTEILFLLVFISINQLEDHFLQKLGQF